MSSIENKNYFNRLASNWDNMITHNESKINLILELTGLKKQSKILDIATGTGILINFLEKYQPRELIGIDISNKMIDIARDKFSYPNLELINKDFLEYSGSNFDYAICYSAYPHFMNKKKFIDKLFEILEVGGRFVIAHSEGKDTINNRHSNINSTISSPLKSLKKEAELFNKKFEIDILVDTDEFYIISGKKIAEKIG